MSLGGTLMGLCRVSVGFCRVLRGGSSISFSVMFGGRLVRFRGALVMLGRFLMSLF